ncbi:DUF1937 family protein [Micrococcales bacterium 31B]|nr:DUF1937 family protein [Micrococcales bacterium 31B]
MHSHPVESTRATPGTRSTVMISGPMSGLPEFNRPAFHRAAAAVEARGCRALNPARQPAGLEWEEYMRRSLTDVCASDVVVLLPGWEGSPGARLEVEVAQRLQIPVSTLSEWLSVPTAVAV